MNNMIHFNKHLQGPIYGICAVYFFHKSFSVLKQYFPVDVYIKTVGVA